MDLDMDEDENKTVRPGSLREAQARYEQTEKARRRRLKYERSEARRAAKRAWEQQNRPTKQSRQDVEPLPEDDRKARRRAAQREYMRRRRAAQREAQKAAAPPNEVRRATLGNGVTIEIVTVDPKG